MIDFDEKDIVAVRRTADGNRFLLFTNSDLLPHWGQSFWTVVLDTGGDGFGIQVRFGEGTGAPSGWTTRQLAKVVHARMTAEHARMPGPDVLAVLEALDRASAHMPAEALDGTVTFEAGGQDSVYPWTLARSGDLALPFCPDPASEEEGIAPELVLILLDQMLKDWVNRAPNIRTLWATRKAISEALNAEVQRVRIVRGEPKPAGCS